MNAFTRGLAKVFLWIFLSAIIAGVLVGGVGGLFVLARALAPWAVGAGLIIYGLIRLAQKAEAAEAEENQSLNLARAIHASEQANKDDTGPIIP